MKKLKPGEVIRRYRNDRGWTGAELARRAKLSASQISKIEKAQENLTVPSLLKIAKALGIKPCVFLMDEKDEEVFDALIGIKW